MNDNSQIDVAQYNVPLLQNTYDTEPITENLEKIIEMMRSNEDLKRTTITHRSWRAIQEDNTKTLEERMKAKTTAIKLKQQLPVMIPGALCVHGKKRENIKSLLPFIPVDIDHISEEEAHQAVSMLSKEPSVVFAHITCSGKGVHAAVAIDCLDWLQDEWRERGKRVYQHVWSQVQTLIESVTGHLLDKACNSPEHLFAICHDEAIYFNPEPTAFHIVTDVAKKEVKKERKSKTSRLQKAENKVFLADALEQIDNDLTSQECFYEDQNHNNYLFRFASLCNDYGVDIEEVEDYAQSQFIEIDTSECISTIRSAYNNVSSHGTKKLKNANGKAKFKYCTIEELKSFISAYGSFRRNVVSGEYEVCPLGQSEYRPMEDEDENEIWSQVMQAEKYTTGQMVRNLIRSAFTPEYNPIKEYFSSLPKGELMSDGTFSIEGREQPRDYIKEVAQRVHLTDDDGDFTEYFRKWIVSAVKGWILPNEFNQYILVLVGRQGIYKTTFLQYLLPPCLRRGYVYTKTNSAHMDKDDKMKMSHNLLMLLEEMDEMTDADMNQLKAMTTMRTVDERPAYGRNVVHQPRINSFAGTGNKTLVLTDTTGNRRFFIFDVDRIDTPQSNPIDYEAFYAQVQALARPDSGFVSYVETKDVEALNEYNKRFMVPVLELDLVRKFLDHPTTYTPGLMLTAGEIVLYLQSLTSIKLSAKKVAACLREEGYLSTRERVGTKYNVVKLDAGVVNQREKAESVDDTPL